MSEQLDLMEKEILESLPQVPIIIDQVGHAIKWVKDVEDEGKALSTLRFAKLVEDYAFRISERMYFKTHLLIGALLFDLDNVFEDKRFGMFKTASGEVEKVLRTIHLDEKLQEEKGCFKALMLQLSKMAKENEECFCIHLLSILNDLQEISRGMKKTGVKTPITPADYIKVLGYSYSLGNIKAPHFNLLDTTGDIINKIYIELNESFNF